MSRSRIAYCTTRLGAVFAAALAGLLAASLALPGVALAATLPPAVSAQLARPQLTRPVLAGATPVKTITTSYSCDLTGYGASMGSAAVSVKTQTATSWPVNQPDDIVLQNDAIPLPSGVTSLLSGVNSIVVKSTVAAKHATKQTIDLAGLAIIDSAHAPTEIPAIDTLGQVTFAAKGSTGSVALPAHTITFTPMAGTTAKPDITCTTSATATDVTITVGDASGPFYRCTTTAGSSAPSVSAGLFPLTITEAGTKKTGQDLTVTISSDNIALLIVAAEVILAQAGVTLDKAAFSADLAVTGAQTGTLHIAKTITDLSATTFSASGKLSLTKAGTVKVDIPSTFGLALSASGNVLLDLSCALVTKPAPVALTVTVTQGPSSTPSATATATDNGDTDDTGATTEPTGTPVGGAATGGGGTPVSGMPLAFGGVALALTGGGLLLARATVPRRRKPRPGAAQPGQEGSGQGEPAGPAGGSQA